MVLEKIVTTSTTNIPESSVDYEVEEPQVTNKGTSLIIQKDHPKEMIIGNPRQGVVTRSREVVSNACFVSNIEPKNVKKALTDEFWINVLQDELR